MVIKKLLLFEWYRWVVAEDMAVRLNSWAWLSYDHRQGGYCYKPSKARLMYPIGTSKMGAPRHCNERAEGEKKTDSCYGSKARSKRQKANQTTRRLTRGSWLPCQKRPELRWKGSNHQAEREKITPMWNRQAASSSLVSMALRALGCDEKPNVKVEKVKARPRMAHCQRTQPSKCLRKSILWKFWNVEVWRLLPHPKHQHNNIREEICRKTHPCLWVLCQ